MKTKLFLKKIKGAICALFFMFSALLHAEEVTIDGITYWNWGGGLAVKNKSIGYYSGNIVIPSIVEYNNFNYPVTAVQGGAFYNCTNLISVTLPDSIESIGDGAFNNCTSLLSVNIPNSITSISQTTFKYCSSLTSINLPNSITMIGSFAFSGCTSLVNISFSNSLTFIDWYAFEGCTSITQIVIPNLVNTIRTGAFMNCTSLNSVRIPNSVTYIGDNVFYNCSSLRTVICENTNPANITMGTNVFYGVPKNRMSTSSVCELHVPEESINLYSNANQWQDFEHILPLPTLSTTESQNKELQIYPNPVKDILHFSKKIIEGKLFSMEGKVVKKVSGKSLDTALLPKGIYILIGTDSKGSNISKNVIKE